MQQIWPAEGGYSIKKRLLYVACARARDHLVVSLHRTTKRLQSLSEQLVDHGAADAAPPWT